MVVKARRSPSILDRFKAMRKSKSPQRKSKSPKAKSSSPKAKSVSPKVKSASPKVKSASPKRKSLRLAAKKVSPKALLVKGTKSSPKRKRSISILVVGGPKRK